MPWWVVALAVPILLAACGATPPTPAPVGSSGAASPGDPSANVGPSAADVDAASTVLAAVRLDGTDSIAALEGVRFTAGGRRRGRQRPRLGTRRRRPVGRDLRLRDVRR